MLSTPGAQPIRAQGPLVEDHEIEQIVDFIEQGKPSYEWRFINNFQARVCWMPRPAMRRRNSSSNASRSSAVSKRPVFPSSNAACA